MANAILIGPVPWQELIDGDMKIVSGTQLITGATSGHISTGLTAVKALLSCHPATGSSTYNATVSGRFSGTTVILRTAGATGVDNHYDWTAIGY